MDGQFEEIGPIEAGATMQIAGQRRGGVPEDATGVMLNVTAVDPTAPGYITVYPCDERRPLASNLNYQPGDVIPNTVAAKIGNGGLVLHSLATTHIVVDINGYIPRIWSVSEAERDALDALYHLSPWWLSKDSEPCVWWPGTTCDASGVVTVQLNEWGLTGAITPEIGNLTNLTNLYLSGNYLTSIPPEIGNLTNLTNLSLDGNQLTSLPPEIGNLTNLTNLQLGINDIGGDITAPMAALRVGASDLVWLSLSAAAAQPSVIRTLKHGSRDSIPCGTPAATNGRCVGEPRRNLLDDRHGHRTANRVRS